MNVLAVVQEAASTRFKSGPSTDFQDLSRSGSGNRHQIGGQHEGGRAGLWPVDLTKGSPDQRCLLSFAGGGGVGGW